MPDAVTIGRGAVDARVEPAAIALSGVTVSFQFARGARYAFEFEAEEIELEAEEDDDAQVHD